MHGNELRDVRFAGATIIEHRSDGSVAGVIEYGGVNGDLSIGIGWRQFTCGNRTTVFAPSNWDINRDGNVIFLKRKGEDDGFADIPWRNADLYTVVLPT
jgi:hypothetical protein